MSASRQEQYAEIFARECAQVYPEIDELERVYGFAVARTKLEEAARILACPLKVNPPSWQHGRVIYAVARKLLLDRRPGVFLDIGTAKGFSAVVMSWALADAEGVNRIVSVDIVDPMWKISRNSVIENNEELFTVQDFVAPFFDRRAGALFTGGGSAKVLEGLNERVPFAFVDGKHSFESVSHDAAEISELQEPGDVVIFDDMQIPAVEAAVEQIHGYKMSVINAGPMRRYAVAVKR